MDPVDTPAQRLALAGELTIQVITEQRTALIAALDAAPGADLVLDLQAVHGCDSAGVQLLLSAHQTLQRSGRQLWLGPLSPTLQAVLRTYGLRSRFDTADGTAVPEAADANASAPQAA